MGALIGGFLEIVSVLLPCFLDQTAVCFGFRVGEIPVPTRYFAEASSVNFERSVEYGIAVLKLVARFLLHRGHIWRSRKFTLRLEDVLAPRHRAEILRSTRTW